MPRCADSRAVGDLVRRVKQRLGRNAAAIQAHAAEPLLALDEDDFLAQIRRIKRRRITARAGADNHNFSFDRIHTIKFSPPLPRNSQTPSPNPR